MTLSESLILDWEAYCLKTAGFVLPINHLQFADEDDDEEMNDNTIYIGHFVPGCLPPIITKELGPVRKVLISYSIDDIQLEYKH